MPQRLYNRRKRWAKENKNHDDKEKQADRTGDKTAPISLREHKGTAEIALENGPQDQSKDNGGDGKREFP